jgi:hypothetical protein
MFKLGVHRKLIESEKDFQLVGSHMLEGSGGLTVNAAMLATHF